MSDVSRRREHLRKGVLRSLNEVSHEMGLRLEGPMGLAALLRSYDESITSKELEDAISYLSGRNLIEERPNETSPGNIIYRIAPAGVDHLERLGEA